MTIKRMICVMLAAALLLLTAACGRSDAPAAPEATTGLPASTTASEDAAERYMDTIRQYGQRRYDSAFALGYDIQVPQYRYAIQDLNGDGVPELVINESIYDDETGHIGAIYTLDGDRVVELFFIARYAVYTIQADGAFFYRYKGSSLSRLVGTELVEFAADDSYPAYAEDPDGWEERCREFLRENNVPENEMAFQYTTFHAEIVTLPEHYGEVIDGYGQQRFDTSFEVDYGVLVETYYYAVKDINGDGVEELVIAEKGDNRIIYHDMTPEEIRTVLDAQPEQNPDAPEEYRVTALYTYDGAEPAELYFVGRHGQLSISENGFVIYEYKGIEAEKLVGTELQPVVSAAQISDESGAWEARRAALLEENGISPEPMQFDFTRYHSAPVDISAAEE